MTASVRYWKRFTPETSAPVTLTTSCSILPSRVEPIQLRLTASQDGKMAGKHFVITMNCQRSQRTRCARKSAHRTAGAGG